MLKRRAGLGKSARVAQTLAREIRSGRLAHGARLASENELVRRFAVSRNTVRKGLQSLAREGLIATKTGIGSFVTYDGAAIDNALGWTLALSRASRGVTTEVLAVERRASATTSAALELEGGDYLCVDRLRLLDGVGVSLERSRSPWREAFAPALRDGLPDGSLTGAHAAAGLFIDGGEEQAEVLTALGAADARLMGRAPGEAMLRLRRVTRAKDGDVIELVDSILDPGKFRLRLSF